jgi:hypothetical protein
VSDGDLEDLDPSTALDDFEIQSGDELQDLDGHVFVTEDDRGWQGVDFLVLSRRRSQAVLRAICMCVGFVLLWFSLPLFARLEKRIIDKSYSSSLNGLAHKDLPGANDTLVVMRTGSTELQDKLPIHMATTLLRYPDSIIFSDYEEDFENRHMIDALESVNSHLKETSPDFEIWRRLKQDGRSVLQQEELSGQSIWLDLGTGKAKNPGWHEQRFPDHVARTNMCLGSWISSSFFRWSTGLCTSFQRRNGIYSSSPTRLSFGRLFWSTYLILAGPNRTISGDKFSSAT